MKINKFLIPSAVCVAIFFVYIIYDFNKNFKSMTEIESLYSELYDIDKKMKDENCLTNQVYILKLQTVRGQYIDGIYLKTPNGRIKAKGTDIVYFFKFDEPVTYLCEDGSTIKSNYYKVSWSKKP